MPYIESKIPVIFLQEGDKVIAYSPALDLSTCGKDENQARQRFGEMAAIFLRECSEMGTIDEVLEECGWHRVSAKSQWIPPLFKSYGEEKVQIPVRG